MVNNLTNINKTNNHLSSKTIKQNKQRYQYFKNYDLVDRYGISVSQKTTDMFHLS